MCRASEAKGIYVYCTRMEKSRDYPGGVGGGEREKTENHSGPVAIPVAILRLTLLLTVERTGTCFLPTDFVRYIEIFFCASLGSSLDYHISCSHKTIEKEKQQHAPHR